MSMFSTKRVPQWVSRAFRRRDQWQKLSIRVDTKESENFVTIHGVERNPLENWYRVYGMVTPVGMTPSILQAIHITYWHIIAYFPARLLRPRHS